MAECLECAAERYKVGFLGNRGCALVVLESGCGVVQLVVAIVRYAHFVTRAESANFFLHLAGVLHCGVVDVHYHVAFLESGFHSSAAFAHACYIDTFFGGCNVVFLSLVGIELDVGDT